MGVNIRGERMAEILVVVTCVFKHKIVTKSGGGYKRGGDYKVTQLKYLAVKCTYNIEH